MSIENEDPSPLRTITAAGEIVPDKSHLNIGLTNHIEQRIQSLERQTIPLTDIYLLAPWRTIRNRKLLQQNIATVAILQERLIASRHEDMLLEPEVSILTTESPVDVPEDQEAEIIPLPLDNYTAAEHSLTVVDNG